MGGEIITLHIGQAGVQLSHALWELVCCEHGVSADGRRSTDLFDLNEHESGREYVFREVHREKFVPRALLIDLEPSVIDEIRTGAYRGLWNPHNLISGKEDAASNFARGYYSQTRFEMADVMERIRILVEQADNLSCFKLLYSANGGTGSGLTSALCERLSDEYGKKYKFATTVYPSPGYSELMVEPYNALLHSSTNLTFCDCVMITDNEAMLNVAEDSLRLHHEGFTVPNRVIANAITTQFLSHRYKFIGQQHSHVDELLINLIPYPRIHFPMMAFAPFLGPSCQEFEKSNAVDLVRAVFEDTNQLLSVSAVRRAYISCALLFRGSITPLEAINAVAFIKGDRTSRARFVDWCPTGFKLGVNFAAPTQAPTHNTVSLKNSSLSMIAGNLAIRDVWTGIGRRFDQLYEKRAYVHWYVAEGMEEGEFTLAREVIQQLIEDYEAIARDAEGAVYDASANQSQNQQTRSTARIAKIMKQSPLNPTEANVNQATTLDDQNSLHTLDNNEENLSLDTNQHHSGMRGGRMRGALTRNYLEVDSYRDRNTVELNERRFDAVPRVNPNQRRRLIASRVPQQLIQAESLANEQYQKSSNALVEPVTQRPPLYGTNCSAAVNPPMLSDEPKYKSHHRCKKLKQTNKNLNKEFVNIMEGHSCRNRRDSNAIQADGKSLHPSNIPIFSDKRYKEEVYRKTCESHLKKSSVCATHRTKSDGYRNPNHSRNELNPPISLTKKSIETDEDSEHFFETTGHITPSSLDSDESTIHVYQMSDEEHDYHPTQVNNTNMSGGQGDEINSEKIGGLRQSMASLPVENFQVGHSSSRSEQHGTPRVESDSTADKMSHARTHCRARTHHHSHHKHKHRSDIVGKVLACSKPAAFETGPPTIPANELPDETDLSETLQTICLKSDAIASYNKSRPYSSIIDSLKEVDVRSMVTCSKISSISGSRWNEPVDKSIRRTGEFNFKLRSDSQKNESKQAMNNSNAELLPLNQEKNNFSSAVPRLVRINREYKPAIKDSMEFKEDPHPKYLSTTVIKVRNITQMPSPEINEAIIHI